MKTKVKKICILGAEGVGKTSLVKRYVDNQFSQSYKSTIGVQISDKKVTLSPEESIQLILWDIEGLNYKNEYPLTYLLGASAYIFVGDTSREESISALIDLDQKICKRITTAVPKYYALNKIDLIGENEAMKQLSRLKCSFSKISEDHFFLSSAKDNLNVHDLFETIAKDLF
jgi:small GTP-binding protein